MRTKLVMGVAAFVLGTACASAPALAKKTVTIHPAPSYSNTGPWKAPLSPNGSGAGASAFGGPSFNGPYGMPYHASTVTYSTVGPWKAPLSPNGSGAGASAFGGPSFNGPYGVPYKASTIKYSTLGPKGAPLSPDGAGAGASAFGGPGFQMF